jgi:hypothetical protein
MTSLQTEFHAVTSHRIVKIAPDRLWKDLSPAGWLSKRGTRPAFVHDPEREPAAYRSVLGPSGVGPRCFSSGRDWLEIELVDGVELWQIGDVAVWVAAARALAATHHRLRNMAACRVPFMVHDAELATAWRLRAGGSGVPTSVLAAHERAWQRLQGAAPTVIHGDVYPSNVLVRSDAASPEPKIIFIDWELIGLGPAVLDVAAITAGAWYTPMGDAMTRGYYETASTLVDSLAPWESWCEELDAARLHLCVQWTGWASGWRPPKSHRRDWIRDARTILERL